MLMVINANMELHFRYPTLPALFFFYIQLYEIVFYSLFCIGISTLAPVKMKGFISVWGGIQ